jgi:sulfite oxidase
VSAGHSIPSTSTYKRRYIIECQAKHRRQKEKSYLITQLPNRRQPLKKRLKWLGDMTSSKPLLLLLLRALRPSPWRPPTVPQFTRITKRASSSKSGRWEGFKWHSPPKGRTIIAAFAGGGAVSVFATSQLPLQKRVEDAKRTTQEKELKGIHKEDVSVRQIRLADVKKHDASSGQPWVTKGNKVYDITNWVGAHPGGEVILRAAGGSIDPYWNIFAVHKQQYVYDILEQYLIGEINPLDLVDGQVPADGVDDPFVSDPVRDARLRTLTDRPRNAETPGEGLSEFLTPNGLFYVRNHMWVPEVEEAKHRLIIELPDGEEKSYTMQDLKEKFKRHKITATLQCAGNRRKDMTDHAKQTNGLQWTAGAISSAEWEGVKLRDVLADAGLDTQNPPDDAQHAQFMGLEAYGASIPMSKVIDPTGDVLLAFAMNGEPLPRDHGFPLRTIVPGNVAARSVKWLSKVIISEEESTTQWQRRDYKSFGPNVGANPDWSKAKSIQEMPITSAITGIRHHASEPCEKCRSPLSISGYAYSGGGREIIRVDISTDNGVTWDQADLVDDDMKGSKAWCWKRWVYHGLKDCGESKKVHLIVKAVDDAYNTQPESYKDIYNVRGNLATAWHRVDYEEKDGDDK